jgi:hypothetical protein
MPHPEMVPFSFTYPPVASMWVVTLHNLFLYLTHPYPVTPLPNAEAIFKPNPFPVIPQQFSNPVHSSHTYLPMKMEQSVPKHQHINFRRRGINQKKAYNKKVRYVKPQLFSKRLTQ